MMGIFWCVGRGGRRRNGNVQWNLIGTSKGLERSLKWSKRRHFGKDEMGVHHTSVVCLEGFSFIILTNVNYKLLDISRHLEILFLVVTAAFTTHLIIIAAEILFWKMILPHSKFLARNGRASTPHPQTWQDCFPVVFSISPFLTRLCDGHALKKLKILKTRAL